MKKVLLFISLVLVLVSSCQSANHYGCKGNRCVEMSKKQASAPLS